MFMAILSFIVYVYDDFEFYRPHDFSPFIVCICTNEDFEVLALDGRAERFSLVNKWFGKVRPQRISSHIVIMVNIKNHCVIEI